MKTALISSLIAFSSSLYAESIYFGAQSADVAQNENCYLHAKLPYAYAADTSGTAIAESLNQHFKDELSGYRTDFTSDAADNCADPSGVNRVRVNFDFTSPLDGSIVSVMITEVSDTGGQHANRVVRAETFDASTGVVYPTLASFLKPEAITPFKALVEEQLQNTVPDFSADAGWKTLSNTWTDLGKVTDFAFTPEGLTLLFNDYEIAPGAGAVKVLLEWDDLKDLGLQSSGPALKLKTSP